MEDKYSKYANFKKRVLLKAQEDIEKHTDIRFTFEEISEFSRSVEKLVFTIHKNKKTVIESNNTNSDSENENENGHENKRHEEIRAFGVSQVVLENQILGEFEEEFIKQTLKFCKDHFKTNIVKQKSGFFLKALQNGYYKQEIESLSKKNQKKKNIGQQESKQTELEKQKNLAKKQRIEELRAQFLTPELIEKIIQEQKETNLFMYNVINKSYQQGIVNPFLEGLIDKKLLEEFGDN